MNEKIMETSHTKPKFVYRLAFDDSIYLDKDEAIVALLSHFDRLCHTVDTYDLEKHRYVKHEELVDLLDEDYLNKVLVQHPHLRDAVAEVKQDWADSVELDEHMT